MSDTPRTDARVFSLEVEVRGADGEPQTESVDVVYEGFARELERELAQRTAERDALRAELAALKANDPLAKEGQR